MKKGCSGLIVKERRACARVKKSLKEGKLQSDSGVLWNVLEDLNLLILNRILYFPCNGSLVLWRNDVKLSRASWELTVSPPFTLIVLPSCRAAQFLRAVVKCQSGGTVVSTNYFIHMSHSVEWSCFLKWSCISETFKKWSQQSDFFNCHYTGLASFVFYLLSACEICKIETVQYVYFVNLPFL